MRVKCGNKERFQHCQRFKRGLKKCFCLHMQISCLDTPTNGSSINDSMSPILTLKVTKNKIFYEKQAIMANFSILIVL
jgi:hypothetical protein